MKSQKQLRFFQWQLREIIKSHPFPTEYENTGRDVIHATLYLSEDTTRNFINIKIASAGQGTVQVNPYP